MAITTQHSHSRIRRRLHDHSLGTWEGIVPKFYAEWYGRVRRAHSWRMLHEFFSLRRQVRLKERQLLEWLPELGLDHRIQSFFGSFPNYSSINAFDQFELKLTRLFDEFLFIFKDLVQGTGWLELSPAFYGFFQPAYVPWGEDKVYNVALGYALTVIFVLLFSLACMGNSFVLINVCIHKMSA